MAGMGVSNQISNWAGGGAQVTLGAAQLAYGMYLDKHNKRPKYEIPPEIAQNLSMAQQQALEGLPEAQKQEYISNLQRSQAYSLNELGSRKAGISGVAALNENQNKGYANMLAQDSAARMQNQSRVYGMNQNVADYKDEAFQINKLNPYYEMRTKAQGLMGAGTQNIGTGFQGSGSGAVGNQNSQPTQNTTRMDMSGYDQNQTKGFYQNTPQMGSPYNGGQQYQMMNNPDYTPTYNV